MDLLDNYFLMTSVTRGLYILLCVVADKAFTPTTAHTSGNSPNILYGLCCIIL